MIFHSYSIMNHTVAALCRDLSLSREEAWVAFIWAWFSVSLSLSLGLLLFSVTKARLKAKEINEYSESVISEDEECDSERKDSLSSMYVRLPLPEEVDKERQYELEAIAEDDECFYEDESDCTESSPPSRGSTTTSPTHSSNSLQHLQLPSLQKDVYLRSHSTGDEAAVPYRNSLQGAGTQTKKGSGLRRTEPQNRADYLLRVSIKYTYSII